MEEYSIKDVTRTFGLSRSSILYYEKLGIICSKKNPNNGYRVYSHDEINRLKECVYLKNMGYTVKEVSEMVSQIQRDKDNELKNHILKVKHQIDIEKAVLERLTQIEELSNCYLDQIEMVEMPEHLYLHSGCETGYHEINQSPESNLLIQNLPITQFISVYHDYAVPSKTQKIIGRCILAKNAKLLFENPGDIPWTHFGGCKAVRIIKKHDGEVQISNELIKRVDEFADDHCLKLSSSAYVCYMMPNLTSPLVEIYFPIQEV